MITFERKIRNVRKHPPRRTMTNDEYFVAKCDHIVVDWRDLQWVLNN
ncbi:MAG: hypothetical protein CEN89_506 [Candidatus Berkelbacteria bacterium Licking1014_7]|uniref:Uncharacterized protein n=1 Tax=Candidatus Berkelbacteria bacterium Licking1014_7 TaxID=2017147 RepID=A0A554LIN2_9BACT|nr:MAG: hypothetical protein CEN89_506 [Candidatus Berkelbacteria bacterium Licking1014_7]